MEIVLINLATKSLFVSIRHSIGMLPEIVPKCRKYIIKLYRKLFYSNQYSEPKNLIPPVRDETNLTLPRGKYIVKVSMEYIRS
nr:hypothetical protein [Dinophyceae sp. MRD-151]